MKIAAKSRKSIVIAVATVATVATAMLAGCTGAARPTSQADVAAAERVTVATGTVENRIVATGKVVARSTTSLAFSQSGVVRAVKVAEGQQVKAGNTLAVLDSGDLALTERQQYANYIGALASYSATVKGPSAGDLASAEASLASAKAALELAQRGGSAADKASASASLSNAQTTLNELDDAPTTEEFASLKASLDNAKVSLDQAQASYDNAFRRDPAGIGANPAAVSLEQATNNYVAAKANYDKAFAKPDASRYTSARQQIAAANATLNNLKPQADKIASAEAQVVSAQAKLDGLQPADETVMQQKAKVEQARAAWEAAAKRVQDATLIAPMSGIITSVRYSAGDWAAAGQTAIAVADFATPIFEVDVDEADLGGIQAGQDANVRLQTYPGQPIAAKVESVATVGTNNGAIVNYKVKLSLGKANGESQPVVLINMSGTGEIVTGRTTDAVVVPNTVVTVDPQTKRYTVDRLKADNTIEKVQIELGFRDARQTQIVSGVGVGDVLVIPSRTVRTVGPGQQN
jgi:RND family efflux transporter MFP subunit